MTVFKLIKYGSVFMLFRHGTLTALMLSSAIDMWNVETEPRLFEHISFTAPSL